MARKYTSLYKEDPIAEELAAGIQGTDVYQGSPYMLSSVPEFEGMKTATTDYNRLRDLYSLYSGGGFDASQEDFPIQAEDIIGGDGGTGGTGTGTGGTGTGGINTPFEQNLIDQGIGVQGVPGDPVVAPGEYPYTQTEMDAFNQIPVNREYGDPMDIGYGEGQVDPKLAAAVGGKDTTPLGGANLVTLPSGDIFAADDPMLREKMDYNPQDPKFWEDAKNKFIETGQDVGNIFTNLKNKGINIGKLAGGAIMNMIFPGAGLLLNMLPEQEPDLIRQAYEEAGVKFDDIGRIVQQPHGIIGQDAEGKNIYGTIPYDTPENVMAGYYPGKTGYKIPFTDIQIGGKTIEESVMSRLEALEKTKNEKYGGSFYNADGTPKINPDNGLPTTLGSREEALKQHLNITAQGASGVEWEPYNYGDQLIGGTTKAPEAGVTLGPAEYWPQGEELGTAEQLIAERDSERAKKNELAKLTGDWGNLETAIGTSDVIDEDIVNVQEVKENIERAKAREENERAAIAREEARVAEAKAIADAAAERERQYKEAQERMNRRGDAQDMPSGGGGPPGGEGRWKGFRGGRVRYSEGGIVSLKK